MTVTRIALTTALFATITACSTQDGPSPAQLGPTTAVPAAAARSAEGDQKAAVSASVAPGVSPAERGKYLVMVGGCNDCHTPMKMTPTGPGPDMERMLSGHPEQAQLPPAPAPQGPWAISVAMPGTAWSGPWGTSFTANLTPDKETGLGAWTPDMFIATLRTARHMGTGRPLLPPMPAANIAQMTDEDLKSIFAYLQTIPAISNHVPQPQPPSTAGAPPVSPDKHAGANAPADKHV